MIRTPADFIQTHGPAAIAKATGRKRGVVDVWRHRFQFPRTVWPELMAAFPALTIDALRKMESAGERARKKRDAERSEAA